MTSTNNFYVYMYHDPVNMKPFYVGKGKGRRYIDHLQEAKRTPTPDNNHKLNKIRKIIKTGCDPIISFYILNVSENVANLCESAIIKKYGRIDIETGILTNKTDGGDGLSGHYPTKETRKKLSTACSGEKNGMYGKTHSPKTKKIFSEMRTGKSVSAQHLMKIQQVAEDRKEENSWEQAKKNALYDRFSSYSDFKTEVLSLYEQYNKSPTLIAHKMNVTVYPVATLLKHNNYEININQTLTKLVKNYGLRWLSVEEYHNDILILHNSGLTYCEIASTLKVNPYGVKKYIDSLRCQHLTT